MENPDFYRRLRDLADYEPFQNCIGLSERPLAEQYDMELALRFVIFSSIDASRLTAIGDIGAFLTDSMIEIARDQAFDMNSAERRFNLTFELLDRTVAGNAFRRYKKNRYGIYRFLGGFILSAFEVIALGIGWNIESPPPDSEIENRIKNIWDDSTYKEWSGAGLTAMRRLRKLVPLGRQVFQP